MLKKIYFLQEREYRYHPMRAISWLVTRTDALCDQPITDAVTILTYTHSNNSMKAVFWLEAQFCILFNEPIRNAVRNTIDLMGEGYRKEPHPGLAINTHALCIGQQHRAFYEWMEMKALSYWTYRHCYSSIDIVDCSECFLSRTEFEESTTWKEEEERKREHG